MTELARCSAWITRNGERKTPCTSKARPHAADEWVDLCREHSRQASNRYEKDLRESMKQTMSQLVQKNIEVREAVVESLMKFSSILEPAPYTGPSTVWRTDTPRYVYFIGCQDYIKIGCSADPRERLKVLRNSGNGTKAPRGIDLWDAQLLRADPGTLRDEQKLHKKFAHLRVEGEWFRADRELLDYIDHLHITV